MTGFDGSPADMPILSGHPDWLSPDDAIAELLLSGQGAEPGVPPRERALALVLAAAARPATPRELSGEQAAVTAFELAFRRSRPRPSVWTRAGAGIARPPRARRVPALIGAGVLALAAVLSGTAAADALPAPLQLMAHHIFGAPAPAHGAPRPSVSPGPTTQDPRRAGPTISARTARPKAKKSSKGKAKGHEKAASATSTPSSGNGQGNDSGNGKSNGKAKHAKASGNGKGNGNGKAKGHASCHGNGKKSCDQAAPLRRPQCSQPARREHRHRRAHFLVARSDRLPAQVPCVHALADDRQLHPGKREVER
jgi:hypothetical protein